MLSRLFGKGKAVPPEPAEEPLVIVPIPPLVTVLLALRNQKGEELTEAEVLQHRDDAVCMTMRVSQARQLAEKRGYDDIRPEHVWQDWQAFLADDHGDGTG